MHPNHAALGYSGVVRRRGLSILLLAVALLAMLPACKQSSKPQNPVAPPATGFALTGFVTATAAAGGNNIAGALVEITSGVHSGTSTTTDSDGRYSIPGLTGSLNVRYSREGYVPTGRTVAMSQDVFLNVALERGETPPGPEPTYVLSGIVSEGQGDRDDIAGALVEVVDGPHAGDSATTDTQGRYTIPDLSGDLTVRASHDSFAPEEQDVAMTADQTVFFTLYPPVQVSMCLDLDDQEVHLTNDDTVNELRLTDWVLRERVDGNEFTFVEDLSCRGSMSGFTLAPGATVIITAGDSPTHTPPTHIAGWCEAVWKIDGDTAWLAKGDGTRIAEAIGSTAACGG